MIISIDIGGTFTRVGNVENNEIIKFKTSSVDETFKKIYESIYTLCDGENIDKIGISCCGPTDYKNGKILIANNLSDDWHNLEVVKKFQDEFPDTVVKYDNDVNVAALGQYVVLNKKVQSLVYITFSTGIGGGLILNDKIYHGFIGQALEIANSSPQYKNSDKSGIEYWLGGNGLVDRFKKADLKVNSTKECFDLYYQGNQIASEIFDICIEKVHSFLCTLIYILDPEIIIIGGSVALNQKEFFDKIISSTLETIKNVDSKTQIIYGEDLDKSTLIGCTKL